MTLHVAALLLGLLIGSGATYVSATWFVVDVSPVSVCLGLLAVAVRRAPSGRRAALPSRCAVEMLVVSVVLAVAALHVRPRWPGVTQGELLVPTLVCIAVAAAAQLFGTLVLYAGVQKTTRLSVVSAVFAGGAIGLVLPAVVDHDDLLPGWLPASEFLWQPLLVSIAGGAVFFLSRARAVREHDMAAEIREMPWTGLGTTLGIALVGVALGWSWIHLRQVDGSSLDRWAVLVFLGCLWVVPVRQPTVRRAALLLGSATLLSVAAVGFVMWSRRVGSGGWWLEGIGVLPFAFAGFAAPVVARLYAEVPLGSNILSEIPPEERRAPDGGVLRLAALAAGGAVGASLVGMMASPELVLAVALLGGLLLVLFDPRAGPGRKVGSLVIAGLPAITVVIVQLRA